MKESNYLKISEKEKTELNKRIKDAIYSDKGHTVALSD